MCRYDANSAQVKAMENQATRLSGAAREESRVAGDALDQITSLETELPGPHKVLSRVSARRVAGAVKPSRVSFQL